MLCRGCFCLITGYLLFTSPRPRALEREGTVPQPEDQLPKFRWKLYEVYRQRCIKINGSWEANDQTSLGQVQIKCRKVVFNEGCAGEFVRYTPTTLQLSKACRVRRCRWESDWGQGWYGEDSRSGKPRVTMNHCMTSDKRFEGIPCAL